MFDNLKPYYKLFLWSRSVVRLSVLLLRKYRRFKSGWRLLDDVITSRWQWQIIKSILPTESFSIWSYEIGVYPSICVFPLNTLTYVDAWDVKTKECLHTRKEGRRRRGFRFLSEICLTCSILCCRFSTLTVDSDFFRMRTVIESI